VDIEAAENHGKVTIYTRDRAYLLSDICGVLAVNDLNILSADAYTRTDGVIVDIFTVEAESPEVMSRPEFAAALRKTFAEVWAGRASVSDLIGQHRRRWARRKAKYAYSPPHVVVDNTVSEQYSVIDVFTLDRIGLLYDLSRTLSTHGLDIHMARIGTDGDRVADAFYVTTGEGGKLLDADESERIRAALLEAAGQAQA